MKKSMISVALAAPLALASGADKAQAPDRVHVVRSGSVHVDAPPHRAFRLFTAPGETLWVDDWSPVVLSGDGLEAGSVFVTEVQEKTIWIVIDFDSESLHARYARVAPESRAGTVDVKVSPDGKGGSVALVTYELTALSDEGNAMLTEFSEQAYAEMMTDWENAIRDANIDYELDFMADR